MGGLGAVEQLANELSTPDLHVTLAPGIDNDLTVEVTSLGGLRQYPALVAAVRPHSR